MKIDVYTRYDPPCNYCMATKSHLNKERIQFNEYVVGKDLTKDLLYSLGFRKFIELSAQKLGWGGKNGPGIIWEGKGLNEVGRRADNGQIIVRIDPKYFRPTEVDYLLGDSSIARNELGWEPNITLEQMISEMINNDTEEAKKDLILKNEGFPPNNSLETVSKIMN